MVELEGRFGRALRCDLRPGDRGAFEVYVDGALVFSKLASGRLPKRGEIAGVVARLLRG